MRGGDVKVVGGWTSRMGEVMFGDVRYDGERVELALEQVVDRSRPPLILVCQSCARQETSDVVCLQELCDRCEAGAGDEDETARL